MNGRRQHAMALATAGQRAMRRVVGRRGLPYAVVGMVVVAAVLLLTAPLEASEMASGRRGPIRSAICRGRWHTRSLFGAGARATRNETLHRQG